MAQIIEFIKSKVFMLKVISVMLLSLSIVSFLTPRFFLSNTPAIHTNVTYEAIALLNKIGLKNKTVENQLVEMNKSQIAATDIHQLEQELEKEPFIPLTKGTYAKENENGMIMRVVIDEVETVEYTFMIDGIEHKIRVPQGETPPSQEQLKETLDFVKETDK